MALLYTLVFSFSKLYMNEDKLAVEDFFFLFFSSFYYYYISVWINYWFSVKQTSPFEKKSNVIQY